MNSKYKKNLWIVIVVLVLFFFTNYLNIFLVDKLFIRSIWGSSSYNVFFSGYFRLFYVLFILGYAYSLFYIRKYRQLFIYLFFPVYIVVALLLKFTLGYSDGFQLSVFFFFSLCYLIFLLYFFHDYGNSLSLYSGKNYLKSQFEDKYTFEEITIMFIDIQNYTKISEQLKSSELIWLFLNLYISYIEKIIVKHNGIVDKIMGDGIMLLFRGSSKEKDSMICAMKLAGIRIPFLDYIENDVMFGFNKGDISQKNLNYGIILDTLKKIEFNIRIGVATGQVFLGVVGGKKVREMTIIGDHVNLASRLESTNKIYRTTILCDENTIKGLDKDFVFRMVDKIKVKGKEEVKAVFEPIYYKKEDIRLSDMSSETITERHNILKLYFHKDFKSALEAVELYLQKNDTDKIAKVFFNRLHALNQRLVSVSFDWDGTRENSIFCD